MRIRPRLAKVEKQLPSKPSWRHWLEMSDRELAKVVADAYGLTADQVLAMPDDDLLAMCHPVRRLLEEDLRKSENRQ